MDARTIFSIAWQTFTEARRNRVFYSLFFFALVVVANSLLFTEVTIVAVDRMLKDTGIAAINVYALMLTVFIGVGIINREVDRRSIYAVVTKPIRRHSYILGKYLGLLAIGVTTTLIMFACLLVVMKVYKCPIHPSIFAGLLGIFAEMAVLGAFAVLCSSFTASLVSAFLCVAVFISGHISSELLFFSNKFEHEWARAAGRAIFYIVPNLERFNFKTQVTYDLPVSGGELLSMGTYGLAYVASFLIAASLVFSRRDFR